MSTLVLMGSGETAPSLVGVHRQLLASLEHPHCCWLDTPYGFQENADMLTQKTVEFYQQSLQHKLSVAKFRHSQQAAVESELCYHQLRSSNLIFAGPGSPSYVLKHWQDSEIPTILHQKLAQPGNVLVLASAAASAIGCLALPVYEIYKVGAEPHWLRGLNLLETFGFEAIVLPHYNNTTGGNHDTRFCYLGERRLTLLERELSDNQWIWGVDEHTAVILDLGSRRFEVQGKGGFTLRRQGRSRFFEAGQAGDLLQLMDPTGQVGPIPYRESPLEASHPSSTQGLVAQAVEPLATTFQTCLDQADGLGAAQALLDFEQVLAEWSGDTDVHHWQIARSQFRSLLAQLGVCASRGLQDPTQPIAPFVNSLLQLREQARLERQFQKADQIRQALMQAGVEVQDTPEGTRWTLNQASPALKN